MDKKKILYSVILLSSMQRLWYIGKDTVDLEESQDILFNICREGFALKVRFLFCVGIVL